MANAPRIIGDLKRIFPPMDGRFLIGPMAKLGWGTPTIVSLELGLLLEIPRPAFAIAGVLRITLPIEEAPMIKIQVNFLGVVDFEKRQLSFDASLYESYVLFMTLTGDMAVRVYWGDDANFLLSVGGFHPSYRPPPAMGLGDMARLAIIISQPQPLIRAEVYFAVTTNTVQFGAKIELKAGVKIFNVYGFLSLDALIQFDPFQFVVDIAGMLAVRTGTSVLFAVRLQLTLSGPSPWHAKGKASFEIGFIITVTISVHFDVTVGEDRRTALPPIAVIELLLPALNEDAAWRALPPSEHSPQVSLREMPAGGPLVLASGRRLRGVAEDRTAQSAADPDRCAARRGRHAVQHFRSEDRHHARRCRAAARPVRAGAVHRHERRRETVAAVVRGTDSPACRPEAAMRRRSDFMRVIELSYEVIYLRKPRLKIFFLLSEVLVEPVRDGGRGCQVDARQEPFQAVGGGDAAGRRRRHRLRSRRRQRHATAPADAAVRQPRRSRRRPGQPARREPEAQRQAAGPSALRAGSMSTGRYAFLPWMRRGISNEITVPATTPTAPGCRSRSPSAAPRRRNR